MRAIVIESPGGPSSMQYQEVAVPRPGANEVLVRLHAIGVNYIDVYHRTGLYPLPLPFTPGSEGAGVVEEVGANVTELRRGDRVAYAMVPGSYAEYAVVPVSRIVPLPDEISFPTAAAAMLQGLTAQFLTRSTFPVSAGQTVVVHAAAGGVGGLLVQFAKHLGAHVIATASTEKLHLLHEDGADVVIDYTTEDFEQRVMAATAGTGAHVVYDSVGRSTFDGSLHCVGLRGTLVLFGQSSGPVPAVDPMRLAKKGIYLTRPSLAHYITTREELLERARELFAILQSGAARLRVHQQLPLADAARAHEMLESRSTVGKTLLIPES